MLCFIVCVFCFVSIKRRNNILIALSWGWSGGRYKSFLCQAEDRIRGDQKSLWLGYVYKRPVCLSVCLSVCLLLYTSDSLVDLPCVHLSVRPIININISFTPLSLTPIHTFIFSCYSVHIKKTNQMNT